MEIGVRAPSFRVPALREGHIDYVHSDLWHGAWTALCFLPDLPLEGRFLEQQTGALARLGLVLLLVEPRVPVSRSRLIQLTVSDATVLADPIGRLHRRFGLKGLSGTKCRTFLIEPQGIVRFQLVHDLNMSGLNALVEMFQASQSMRNRVVETYPVSVWR